MNSKAPTMKKYHQNHHTRPDQKAGIYSDSSATIPEIWKHRAGFYHWSCKRKKKKKLKGFWKWITGENSKILFPN